jgi:hypothetical protein
VIYRIWENVCCGTLNGNPPSLALSIFWPLGSFPSLVADRHILFLICLTAYYCSNSVQDMGNNLNTVVHCNYKTKNNSLQYTGECQQPF